MKIDKLSLAALNDHKKIKLILKGGVEKKGDDTIGVVSVVYITQNPKSAKEAFEKIILNKNEEDFYMIYSCDFDTYLTELDHYPSIEISKEDLNS